jgi:mono/diheme cytochrome c family protein
MKTLLAAVLVALCALPALADDRALAQHAREILQANCYRCHGNDGANEGGLNYILDRQRLVSRKKIVHGDPDKS